MFKLKFKTILGLGVAVLLAVVLALWLAGGRADLLKSGQIEVASGTSARSLWQELQQQGFTTSTWPWRFYSWRLDAAADLQAGTYQLERGEQVRAVVLRFVSGDVTPAELTITYPEGFTLQQIAERTAARGVGTAEEFLSQAQLANFIDEFEFLAVIPAGRDLEGYLFPDTYKVFPDDTPADVISRMLAVFEQRVAVGSFANGRTLDEIVIMASIIEREVQSNEDMALVAGVLWQRFDDGVGLDADATVRYAINKPKDPLTFQDLQSDSPYNTRKFRGLPPGPISSPGLRAIEAAANPEYSDYYFYLSAPSGETIFSETNAEHNANKAKYLR